MTRYNETDRHCEMRYWSNVTYADLHVSEPRDPELTAIVDDLMTLDAEARDAVMVDLAADAMLDLWTIGLLCHQKRVAAATRAMADDDFVSPLGAMDD